MGELVNETKDTAVKAKVQETAAVEIMEVAEAMLAEVQQQIVKKDTMTVPIQELSTLGGSFASMEGQVQKITQEININMEGYYRPLNMNAGDTLKTTKAGKTYGFKVDPNGKSSCVAWNQAGDIKEKVTTEIKTPPNPAMMMMAASLYSIEQQLGRIEELQEKMMSFLQMEKEAEIEGDIESLLNTLKLYKLNWDNEKFVSSHHHLVLAIKHKANQNMIFYRKQAEEAVSRKKFFVAQSNVNAALKDLKNKFQYYQMSLYVYGLASMLEIMLSGNYQEANVSLYVEELRKLSEAYRKNFDMASAHIEKLGDAAVETTFAKGVGHAGKKVGKVIGAIPFVNKGPVDEFLQEKGTRLQEAAGDKERAAARDFAALSNPCIGMFTDKLEDLCKIYNHTEAIYFDHENIYLVGDKSV